MNLKCRKSFSKRGERDISHENRGKMKGVKRICPKGGSRKSQYIGVIWLMSTHSVYFWGINTGDLCKKSVKREIV